MARYALSQTKQAQIIAEEKRALYVRALARYQHLQEQTGSKKARLCSVCHEIMAEYRRETGNDIVLYHSTLAGLVKGCPMKIDFNATKGWVTDVETEQLIAYVVEMAEWGHPLNLARLKEHAEEILSARLGSEFPGVSKNWAACFVEKHSS
ncbi:hypothetical protein VKT23_008591 [Stygiomarasmius scandens]|uniref:HTH CENPB-type domain-containing protein n=1 Tax=Marasmiellus scandens TaxID=2682957 RepID=A0ABR1JL51_9AGAR